MPASKVQTWKKKRESGGHITLPSGTEVRIEVPNVIDMLANGEVPNELVKFATEAAEAMQMGVVEADMDKIRDASKFYNWLVATTVKDPPDLTPEDIRDLPTEDADMIMEFAMRQRDTDYLGHQLHGLETLEAWRKFRIGR